MRLENKCAIVTGGASGIGRSIVTRFAEEGARVVIADVDADAGEALASALTDEGYKATFVGCDVSRRLDVRNLVAASLEAYGSIDILVNNAGVVHKADFLDLTEEDFDRVLDINLKGAFLASQFVARQMVSQIEAGEAPGAIVNMASINAVVAIPDQIPYSVSKGALLQLTRVSALALAPYGIRVNAIGPGSIMTDMLKSVNENDDARRAILSRTPLGRIGEPSEIAALALFLASDEASYLTGEIVYADGGRLGLNYFVPVKE